MSNTNDNLHLGMNEAIANIDLWYAQNMRNRQEDDETNRLWALLDQIAEPSIWKRLKATFKRMFGRH